MLRESGGFQQLTHPLDERDFLECLGNDNYVKIGGLGCQTGDAGAE